MKWTLIVISALFWAFSDIITRYASKDINVYLASAISTSVMAVLFTILYFTLESKPLEMAINTQRSFIWAMVAVGIVNVVGGYAYFQFLAGGGNFTNEFGILTLLNLAVVIILGILYWKDPVTLKTLFGLIFGAASIYLLAG